MKIEISFILLTLILASCSYCQTTQISSDSELLESALDHRVTHFDLKDATFIEGLAKLSLEPISGLHFGIELALRERPSEAPDRSIQFSLSLENARVRDIVEALCQFDGRYTWSIDGATINIFARETIGKSDYLLNRELEEITLTKITSPDEALTPLAKLLPNEQLGYAGVGADDSYSQSWSAVFNHLTVRQLMNRASEHMGPRGGWIWSGSKEQRFFFFFPHGFHL